MRDINSILICALKGHDWGTFRMYSDGRKDECVRCGKERNITR